MRSLLGIVAGCLLALSAIQAQEASYTDWDDKTGEYTTRAAFVALTGDDVTLRKPDGEIVKIALGDLATEDADRARELSESETAPTELEPAAPAGESEVTSSDDELIQAKLDTIDTPGKTGAWPVVRWFYGFIAASENKRVEVVDGEVEIVRELNEDGALIYDPSAFFSLSIADESKKDYYAPALYLVGIVGGLFAFIWMLVVMFRESAWFGCGYLVPCVNFVVLLIFIIKNWHVAWVPFLLTIFFWALTLLPTFLVPSWAPDYALLEAARGA